MLIRKAIEILKYIDEAETIMWNSDHYAALHLGAEALKRIDRQRHNEIPIHQPPLPGETMF